MASQLDGMEGSATTRANLYDMKNEAVIFLCLRFILLAIHFVSMHQDYCTRPKKTPWKWTSQCISTSNNFEAVRNVRELEKNSTILHMHRNNMAKKTFHALRTDPSSLPFSCSLKPFFALSFCSVSWFCKSIRWIWSENFCTLQSFVPLARHSMD